MPEERCVISDRVNLIGVGIEHSVELARRGPDHANREVAHPGATRNVLDSGARNLAGDGQEGFDLLIRERRRLEHDRRELEDEFGVGDEQDMALEVLDAEFGKGAAGRRQIARGAMGLLPVVDLAELHAQDAARAQMSHRLEDHFARVEVALDHHEARGLRCIHGRIAVGSDEVDDVVLGAVSAQKRTSFSIDERDLGMFRKMSRVVGELIAEQRHGHGIQLDPGYRLGPVMKCSQQLVAARGADDQHPRLLIGN